MSEPKITAATDVDANAISPSSCDCESPWGRYAVRGLQHGWRAFVRAGLSHGFIKKRISRQWRKVYGRRPIDITYHGIRFRLFPWDNAIESKMLFGSKARERPELRAMSSFVHHGAFVDIGANIGFYSLFAIRAGVERALAVEPNPLALERLHFNISANNWDPQIEVAPVALGAEAGESVLVFGNDDFGGGTLNIDEPSQNQITVEIRTLMDVVAAAAIDTIGIMKIDVEGREDTVLMPFFEQAPQRLWPRLIIMEHVNQDRWSRDVLIALADWGYRTLRTTPTNTLLCLGVR